MHIIKHIILILSLVPVASTAQNSSMDSEEINQFQEEIAQKAGSTNTIKGEFVQKKQLAFLQNEIQSSGRFFYASPDKIKWSYLQPYSYEVIFRNHKLFIDNEGEQSSIDIGNNELFGKLNQLIINSINGKMLQNKNFETTYEQNAEFVVAKLLPTDPVVLKLFREIILTFDKTTYEIHRVMLVEPAGDDTQIFFTKLKTNVPIDDSVFEF